MPSLFIRLMLFLSSYFPLLLIFAVQYFFESEFLWAALVLAIGAASLLAVAVYLRSLRKMASIKIDVQSIARRDGEAMSYIVTYLLPFVALPGDTAGLVSLGIFFVVLGVLYVNSNMIHINPTLNMAGWRIAEITLSSGEDVTLLYKKRIHRRQSVQAIQVGEGIFIEAQQ